jgi:glycerophosphoryl diester phosphodiesterase
LRASQTFFSFLSLVMLAAPSWAFQGPAEDVTIVAHRGGQLGKTENSLGAIRTAANRGISVVELDVRTSRDSQLVIMHDETVDRTTSGTGQLSSLTLEQLRKFRIDRDGGSIPTLAEALAAAKDSRLRLLLDIKPGTSIREVLKIVRQEQAESIVTFGLRRSTDVANLQSAAPSLPVLAFMPNADDAAEFAYAGAGFIRLWSDWIAVDPTLVERTRILGARPWIMIGRHLPRDETEWRNLHARMLATKPDGLITDRPDLIPSNP